MLIVTVWRMNLREQFEALNGYKTPEDIKSCFGISIDVQNDFLEGNAYQTTKWECMRDENPEMLLCDI